MQRRTTILSNSSTGLGDHITGLYAAVGLCRDGWDMVMYYTAFSEWFKCVNEPNLHIMQSGGNYPQHSIDVFEGFRGEYSEYYRAYSKELQYRVDRYSENIQRAHRLTQKVGSARPLINTRDINPVTGSGKYIVISPFATSSERTWSAVNYYRLAKMFIAAGYAVHLVCSLNQAEPMNRLFQGLQAKAHVGMPADFITDLMLGATCVISNDSGMAHFAALLGVPVYIIMAQLPGKYVFSLPTGADDIGITFIEPACPCAPCFVKSASFGPECTRLGCGALQSITPYQVFDRILHKHKH